MTVDEAIRRVTDSFPFKNYISLEKNLESAHTNIAKTVLRHLEPGSRVLDIGSGPCDKTAILQQLGFVCSAYDDLQDNWHKLPRNREKIVAFAEDCGIDFRQANGGPLPFEKESFDMVMLHDILEHLHDSPRYLLNDVLELAKPNGLLFITVPNAVNIRKRIDVLRGRTNLPPYDTYYWYPGNWRGHIREYVKTDLVKLSEYLNLEVLELGGCDHMLQKLPRRIRPIYQLITGIFQGWKDSWSLVARKKSGWSAKKSLSKEELSKILGKNTSYDYGE